MKTIISSVLVTLLFVSTIAFVSSVAEQGKTNVFSNTNYQVQVRVNPELRGNGFRLAYDGSNARNGAQNGTGTSEVITIPEECKNGQRIAIDVALDNGEIVTLTVVIRKVDGECSVQKIITTLKNPKRKATLIQR